MIEGSIMTVGKMYIAFIFVALMVSIGVFLYQMQESNHFKQYVSYQIERDGGLTSETIDRVNAYSEEHFNGVFRIEHSQATEKQPFGEVVEFEARMNIPFLFLHFDSVNLPLSGSGISLIR